MAKIEFSSRANSPAENLLTPIILLLGIVFAVFGIKLKWFRHRLTFNSSASNRTPISSSESTNQTFGVYKRSEIDERDFRALNTSTTYTATSNHHGESSSSDYKAIKVNNELKLIPPAPSYTPPTIHQGNIKTTELRVDFNNNKGLQTKDQKASKYIRVKKEDYNKNQTAPPPPKTKSPQPIAPANHIAQTHNNKPKAAAPLLVPPTPVVIASPPKTQPPPPPTTPAVKQQVKIAVPVINPIPSSPVTVKQDVRNQVPPNIAAASVPEITNPPPPYSYAPPPVIEIENPAIIAKLNSMPTTYIQLNDFESAESDEIPPPTIRSVKFHDEHNSYNDPITITPSSYNSNMAYNDKIEIITSSSNDDLFPKMKPTPRTTGINYLDYQSNNNNRNNKTDENDESNFDDNNDYGLAPLEFLSKTTTTNAIATNTATVKNEMVQNHIKTTNMNSNRDERKIVVDDSDDDDAGDDNMWDLVANHRKNVGRKIEWDQSANVNGKMKHNQRAMMNNITPPDKPKTLRELHSQSRENSKKLAPTPVKATSKSDVVSFGELDDEADA